VLYSSAVGTMEIARNTGQWLSSGRAAENELLGMDSGHKAYDSIVFCNSLDGRRPANLQTVSTSDLVC
jgi:hypothetical protein